MADTSPIRYLVAIGEIGLLQSLFGRIFIPSVVADELNHHSAPPAVRAWMQQSPEWLEVMPPSDLEDPAFAGLDPGEKAALLLGLSLNADLILVDDRKGAAAAASKGFAVTGTLGILDLAAERKLVDLALALDQLKRTNFRYRPSLLDALLKKHSNQAGWM